MSKVQPLTIWCLTIRQESLETVMMRYDDNEKVCIKYITIHILFKCNIIIFKKIFMFFKLAGSARPFIAAHFHGNTDHLNENIHEHYKGKCFWGSELKAINKSKITFKKKTTFFLNDSETDVCHSTISQYLIFITKLIFLLKIAIWNLVQVNNSGFASRSNHSVVKLFYSIYTYYYILKRDFHKNGERR